MRRDNYEPFDSPRASNDWRTGGSSRRDPWSTPRGGIYDDLSASPAPFEPETPGGTLGTAVVAGLALLGLLGLSGWGLFGGPDLLGFLGIAFLPLALALCLTIASALDETSRRPLARSAGAFFLLALLLRLSASFEALVAPIAFLSVLALSYAVRPLVASLRAEAYLPPLGAGWWIWSVVLAYLTASGAPLASVRVALVGALLEWAGPAFYRKTAATRERFLALFRPPEAPQEEEVWIDPRSIGPLGAETRDERETAYAIESFIRTKFAKIWQPQQVTEVLPNAPRFTSYILAVPGNISSDLMLGHANDLASYLSTAVGRDGLPIRSEGFFQGDVVVKPAPEKGGLRIEIRKRKSETGNAWFEDVYGQHYARVIGKHERPEEPSFSVILGIDEKAQPVVAQIGGSGPVEHMLIAGATGSGKSYLMHSILIQLMIQYGPDDLQLAIIDPKRVGIGMRYEGVPHLFAPVADDVAESLALIKRVHDEMQRRYVLMKEAKENRIASYNYPEELRSAQEKIATALRQGQRERVAQLKARVEEIRARRLPTLLLVIDEVASFTSGGDKATSEAYNRYVGLISAQGRAAGVILILGVQKPTQKNLGENIRGNLTQRVALKLAEKGSSQMLLGDAAGDLATTLGEKGDGIYDRNGRQMRFQALLLPDSVADLQGRQHPLTSDYVRKITAFWGAKQRTTTTGTASGPSGRPAGTSNRLVAAAHGPDCDDREWLVIRGLAIAVSGKADVYDPLPLSLTEIVGFARRAAEEYGYVGPAMTEGEVAAALTRFYHGDPSVVKDGKFNATRAFVGPYTPPGQTTDKTLVGLFGPQPDRTPAANEPGGRDPASVIAEISARPSRDA